MELLDGGVSGPFMPYSSLNRILVPKQALNTTHLNTKTTPFFLFYSGTFETSLPKRKKGWIKYHEKYKHVQIVKNLYTQSINQSINQILYLYMVNKIQLKSFKKYLPW